MNEHELTMNYYLLTHNTFQKLGVTKVFFMLLTKAAFIW